ncbi:MAG: FHA domain-containing protein [Chloroflexi bacterium]|nr:MAG: FHA domain-containing protein [Chloroflexota bacterium]
MDRQDVPVLVAHEGMLAGQRWPIDREAITIGRGADCDIILPERQVSRHHARIERRNEGYYLVDLGSKNGTYVNGEEVHAPYRLQDGDEIQIALCVKLAFVGAEATVPLSFEEAAALMERSPSRAPLWIDEDARRVFVRGRELVPPLSPAQYRLLLLLYKAQGRVCSREEVVQAVWTDAYSEGITDQAIDALVRRLRDRLAQVDPDHQYVVTVRGHGFRLENRT